MTRPNGNPQSAQPRLRLRATGRVEPGADFSFLPGELDPVTGKPAAVPDDALRETVRRRLLDVTESISRRAGPDRLWWYNWVSCRDRINSPILDWLTNAELLKRRLASSDAGDFTVDCPDGATAAAVVEIAREMGLTAEVGIRNRIVWTMRDAANRLRRARTMISLLRHGLAWRRKLAGASRAAASGGPWDTVFVTHFGASIGGPTLADYQDSYFGSLPGWLESQGQRVLVMNCPTGKEANTCRIFAGGGAADRLPTIGLLSRTEILRGWLAAWRLPAAALSDPPSGLPRGLIQSALKRNRAATVFGLWLESGLARILAGNGGCDLIHLYENNPWERACQFAADRAGGVRTVGYLHCAISPGHPKYYDTPETDRHRPKPSKIVCTGEAARDVLLTLYRPGGVQVVAGCALRSGYDEATQARPRPPAKVCRILVLLEGLPTAAQVLPWLEAAAAFLPGDVEIVVRGHPLDTPLPVLQAISGVRLGDGGRLKASGEDRLEDALAAADLVVYKSSTTAFTAALMGIPLVWFNDGGVYTDDPLIACSDLKFTARAAEDLKHACDHFTTMDPGEFVAQRDGARRYILSAFSKPTESRMAAFTAGTPRTEAAQ